MKYIFLFIISIFLFRNGISQSKELSLPYYPSTQDYLNNDLSEDEVIVVVREMSPKFIWAKTILDPQTKKRSKTGLSAWAIVYEDEFYINMSHTYEAAAYSFFIKPDIIGHYMIIVFDKETFKYYERARSNHYGYNLQGALMHDAVTWGANWTDKEGNERKILFVNRDYHTKEIKGKKYSQGLLLTRTVLADILNKNKVEKKVNEFTYEEVIDLMNELNKKHETSKN